MKTKFLKSAFLVISFLNVVGSAVAETVHAIIPFEFSANGKLMPAGFYSVRSIPGSTSVLLFVNETSGEKGLSFARTTVDAVSSAQAFSIKTSERTYEVGRAVNKPASITLTLSK